MATSTRSDGMAEQHLTLGKPFPRATVMYSSPSTDSMLARIVRKVADTVISTKVVTGSTRCRATSAQ